jgi:hypothetical protein
VFRKLDVHSQSELIERYRAIQERPPDARTIGA